MEVIATSYTTIRLGQISTAARAAKAAGVQQELPLTPQAQAPAQAEPTLEEVPF